MTIITLDRLREFLTKCKSLFATQDSVDEVETLLTTVSAATTENDNDINTHVLNIDYDTNVKFDTSYIVEE